MVEEDDQDAWLALEDGIQIQFQPGGAYRTGDYWLIPARTETGDVQWPRDGNGPVARPPDGIEHHYAPLAVAPSGGAACFDWRSVFERLPAVPT